MEIWSYVNGVMATVCEEEKSGVRDDEQKLCCCQHELVHFFSFSSFSNFDCEVWFGLEKKKGCYVVLNKKITEGGCIWI